MTNLAISDIRVLVQSWCKTRVNFLHSNGFILTLYNK